MGVSFPCTWLELNLILGIFGVLAQLDIALPKQDENRYNSSRGAHLNLKRAEKARILVNKIPGM